MQAIQRADIASLEALESLVRHRFQPAELLLFRFRRERSSRVDRRRKASRRCHYYRPLNFRAFGRKAGVCAIDDTSGM
jgi:hypothetical protein